tara:strand:- start:257 stop:457 length:201 start_codon:yes stop_codon:yes gene_type:complete
VDVLWQVRPAQPVVAIATFVMQITTLVQVRIVVVCILSLGLNHAPILVNIIEVVEAILVLIGMEQI